MVEILAVITILILLSVLAIPALNLFRSQSIVKDSAKTAQSLFQQARTMAIAQGRNFTVEIDPVAESMVIKDGAVEASKKWLAPAGADIKDVSGVEVLTTIYFKPSGGASNSISVHLKRRDAADSDTSKYYTVTVINTTGIARIYPRKEN